uniref:Uncharacterized protein n=1 Tax=Aegilops tauschii subsp. strangulata TaxID=200361 RepID=A0A453AUI5_AEGTS
MSCGIFINAYSAHKGCLRANIASSNYPQLTFLSIRMYVEIEQNIVNLATRTSDFENGLDTSSYSIQKQMPLQNLQANSI